jgi:hypothetical protein
VYGFAKRQRANVDHDEEREFKEAAKRVLALTEKQLAELLKRGDFPEVKRQSGFRADTVSHPGHSDVAVETQSENVKRGRERTSTKADV